MKSNFSALGLLFSTLKVRGWTHKKLFQLCAWRSRHGSKQTFCSWSPIFAAKSSKLKAKKLLWPHFEFLSFVLGVLGMAEIVFFWFRPPTFGTKSRRWNARKLLQPCFKLPSFMLGALGMTKNNFFELLASYFRH